MGNDSREDAVALPFSPGLLPEQMTQILQSAPSLYYQVSAAINLAWLYTWCSKELDVGK